MIIVNPIAGKGSAKNAIYEIVDELVRFENLPAVFTTQYNGHATKLIHEYAKAFDFIICCGGDGTLNEVISSIMCLDKQIYLGYVPAGTVNDFASTLNITKNPREGVRMMLSERTFACDIGKFNEQFFTYVAGFGAFTDVSYTTSQTIKSVLGKAAYFLESMKHLPNFKTYALKINYENQVIEDKFAFGAITNSKSVGGMQSASTKTAELDDGLFEVLFIRMPQNPLDLQFLITTLLKQEINEKFMCFFKTDRLLIESEEEIRWTLDGEDGGLHKKIIIENKNKAITFLV